MDQFTKEQRSKLMGKIKSKDTKEEVRLAKILWHKGYRYRKHDKTIFGTPDLSFKKYRIAIFVDGEFFHGKNWEVVEKRPKSNAEFWQEKIERNIARDKEVTAFLQSKGWTVLRFWSEDIRKKLFSKVRIIEKHIAEIKNRIDYQPRREKTILKLYDQQETLQIAAETASGYRTKKP